MSVDQATAQWLRSPAVMAVQQDAGVAAAWGALATVSEIVSPLATAAGAQAEAARQLDFLKYPMAVETVEVPGRREDMVGLKATIFAAGGGYAAGLTVFVVGARPADGADRTVLTVLRRLA